MRWRALWLAAGVAGCGAWDGDETGRVDGGLHVEWRFPVLVRSPASEWTLPSYLAHLMGKELTDMGRLDVACATVRNDGATTADLRLQARLPVYAEEGANAAQVGVGDTVEVCANPVFDFTALYALRTYAPASLEVALATEQGVQVASRRLDMAVAPSNELVFDIPGVPSTVMRDLNVVFVTPDEPVVDQLQRQAFAATAFGGFDSLDAYQREPYTRGATVPAGEQISEDIIIEADEVVSWSVLEASGGDWDARLESDQAIVQAWPRVTSGGHGQTQPGAGSYRLVWRNLGAQEGGLVWSRSNTREDVARDALQAVFRTISQRGARYSNIGRAYFDGWQRVRRPAETLEARAANCMDGSFLFASVLELIGMEPVILYDPGHAYVGVRASRGGSRVWAIETTGVGTVGAEEAYRIAQERLAKDTGTPDFAQTDVVTMRDRGVLPFPQ